MELFEKLNKEDSIWDAQIVGKNIFCHDPGNEVTFQSYFSFCLKIAEWPIEIETRTFFIGEAELALNVFSEKCNMNESNLIIIQNARTELVKVSRNINDTIQTQTKKAEASAYESNNKILSDFSILKSKMACIQEQKTFDNILMEMAELEGQLDKTILDSRQTALYNSLTRDFSTIVSQKMAEFAHIEDVQYNKNAAKSFKKAFDLFKASENKYKNSDRELYGLVSEYLFSFDAKRLFNECLVYYNHVYTYIFNKLDDDGKFRFTQYSFDTPKN